MTRILLLDPSLSDEKSHHFSAASALLNEASSLRIPCLLYCNRNASERVRQLPATPHFSVGGYFGRADGEAAFRTASQANAGLLLDLMKLNGQVRRDDFVLFPTVTANMVLAICQWIAGFPPADQPRFGLCLMFPPDWHPSGRISETLEQFFHAGFGFLKPEHKQRMVFTCEIQGLSDIYEQLLEVAPLVMPVTLDTAATPRVAPPDTETPTLTYVGYAKWEKGTHLLPDIVTAVRARCPQVRFVIHLMAHHSDLIERLRARLTGHGDAMTILEGSLPRSEYRELLCRSSLILMPYNARTYRHRGSGVYTDARLLGIPVIAPADTDIGNEARKIGMAVTFDAFTADSVAAAIVEAVARLPQLSAAAAMEASSTRQSAGNYLEALLERLAQGPVTATR